ncbi:hypothetical protein DB31_7592 [Hyalangium minutum]|uniref:Cytochrome c domain-containing protein n=1 Tax=Hyalangium minutum TaxID=394096 RepID=A0A085WKZ2_9BACT|nr:hypothetical protein DB31_7592 [Hyalangium minutum]
MVVGVLGGGLALAKAPVGPRAPPPTLSGTGLYGDIRQHGVASRVLEYSPQYPLWTDGALKRRWVSLPPGKAIDGSRPNAWVFPVGTKFWKEFSFHGRRVETRYMERQADGTWLYASYAWQADESEAVLVPSQGLPGACEVEEGRWHAVPSLNDCKACHQGQDTEVLGFSALQLSTDRDPNALHAEPVPAPGVDLKYLVEHNLLKRLPRALRETPPRLAASTPTERAALGYLHGNCGHCHNDEGMLKGLGLAFRHVVGQGALGSERAVATAVGIPLRARPAGLPPDARFRLEPGRPEHSGALLRMGSRQAATQMPPLGTVVVDGQAMALLSRWAAESLGPGSAPVLSGSTSTQP